MTDDIDRWLNEIGLSKYADLFTANEIELATLPHLSDSDLRELGLPMGPRKKLLAAIADLGRIEPDKPEAAPKEGDRRQLTVMFVDLVGSTALSTRLDLEELRGVIGRYQNVVAAEIARYEGHVARFMGDGVLVYFGYPVAQEDSAERAVRAALAISAVVGLETVAGDRLEVRIGVATGRVVVGDLIGEGAAQEEAVIGETPSLAARLQGLAVPGSIVVAEATRDLLGSLFDLEALGEHGLKGFAEPVTCWRVVSERAVASRFEAVRGGKLSRLVGRDQELSLLEERWSLARDGEGQVVFLTGQAGIGKSRLIYALGERLAGTRHTRLSYQCSPHHVSSALYPVVAQLARDAGFAAEDGAEAKRAKLEVLLRRAADDVAAALPLVGSLLSLPARDGDAEIDVDPRRRKQRTFAALLNQLTALAARGPVLLIFEDAHWADPTSLELLDQIVNHVQDACVLAVVAGRPEFRPAWASRSHVTLLALNRLGRRQGAEIVADVAAGKALPGPVLDQIVARTDGVPLFVEELTKAVLESELLEDAGDCFVLTGDLAQLAIPSTLQDSLMSRLDRSTPMKEIAQIGAAIGREFPHRLLANVSSLNESGLDHVLDELVRADLVSRRGSPPDAIYSFKHALVRDTAYSSLLRAKRQAIHQRIAAALEREHAQAANSEPELLAHHYTEAGLAERAVPYWQQAGRRAAERAAEPEAREHLQRALKLLQELPESPARNQRELEVLTLLGPVLMNTDGAASAAAWNTYLRARDLCDRVGARAQRFPVLWGLWACLTHGGTGDFKSALEVAHEAIELAESLDNEDFQLQAQHAAWTCQSWLGDHSAVVAHADKGLALYDVHRHRGHAFTYGGHDPGLCGGVQSALALWFLGYPTRAAKRAEWALQLAPAVAHTRSTAQALGFTGILHLLSRELNRGLDLADELIRFSNDHGLPLWRANGLVLRNWALSEMGHAEAVEELRAAIQQRQAAGGGRSRASLQLAALAQGLARVEAPDAQSVIEEAVGELERSGERWTESFVRWVRGQIYAAPPRHDLGRAAACYAEACEIARRQGAKSMELRAATSLAELWAQDGRKHDARALLAPIYGWFTEGFDTSDLKHAAALLARLE